jgi:hypothetical protein
VFDRPERDNEAVLDVGEPKGRLSAKELAGADHDATPETKAEYLAVAEQRFKAAAGSGNGFATIPRHPAGVSRPPRSDSAATACIHFV